MNKKENMKNNSSFVSAKRLQESFPSISNMVIIKKYNEFKHAMSEVLRDADKHRI
jgi:hypothetical protein